VDKEANENAEEVNRT